MLDRLISLIAPHECLQCQAEGQLLCAACNRALPVIPERCYRCRRLSPDARTCESCRPASKLYTVQVATVYKDAAKDLVWKLKFAHARAAIDVMSEAMVNRLTLDAGSIIVHVPTATSRVRQRGYDQSALLARSLARRRGLVHVAALGRSGQERQVGAGRRQRFDHLAAALWVKDGASVSGKHVLLIDDVLTTGATLEAAAAVLRKAGAKRVDAIVFAQA